jgi:hypothetical protein
MVKGWDKQQLATSEKGLQAQLEVTVSAYCTFQLEPIGELMGDDLPTDEELDQVQWTTLLYYLHETEVYSGSGEIRDTGASRARLY